MTDTFTSIHIDLRNLTEDHLYEAFKWLGECDYAAPCIIGTLMTETERTLLSEMLATSIADEIGPVIKRGLVTIPPEQLEDAERMQDCFDSYDWDGVLTIARKYMEPAQ